MRDLHDYLTKRGRLDKTAGLDKTRAWKKLFPGQPYDDARLRQTIHWALKATEEFLAYENWQRDPIRKQLNLVAELRRRRSGATIERALKKAEQMQASVPVRNESFYRGQYQLEIERGEYRMFLRQRQSPDFQRIADTLDISYLIEKLKATWNMLFHQRVSRTEFDIRFLEEIVSYVEQLDLEEHPLLAIHYYGYLGLTQEEESGEALAQLRRVVLEHGDLLADNDQRYIILMAINLCIQRINKGLPEANRETLEWYKLGFAADVIVEDGVLTRATYLNVVRAALVLGEYDYVEEFLDTHTQQLEADIRESTALFARARLAYTRGDAEAAMPLLAQTNFKHPTYNLQAKTLQLKIYAELGYYDLLDSQVDSINTYVRRKNLPEMHRANFRNVARLVRQYSRLVPGDREQRAALLAEVTATSPLSEKAWLLEQLKNESNR